MADYSSWSAALAAECIVVPTASSNKYSRGVLGLITGSTRYPGAAVLTADAALHTGVGMARFIGARDVARLVLHRRPEVVTASGRVDAWLLGSGVAPGGLGSGRARLRRAVRDGVPVVLDAGAIGMAREATGPVIITPHFGELGTLLGVSSADIAAEPAHWAFSAANALGVTVLLKGSTTFVAAPHGARVSVHAPTPWLATAGTGDALAGILGALLATNARTNTALDADGCARIAASAAVIHAEAAARASSGGPFTVLDLIAHIPGAISELLRSSGRE